MKSRALKVNLQLEYINIEADGDIDEVGGLVYNVVAETDKGNGIILFQCDDRDEATAYYNDLKRQIQTACYSDKLNAITDTATKFGGGK